MMKRRYRILFAVLLRAFPPSFRRRYGDGMEDAFVSRCAERRALGTWSLWTFLLQTALDMTSAGLRERLHLRKRGHKPLVVWNDRRYLRLLKHDF